MASAVPRPVANPLAVRAGYAKVYTVTDGIKTWIAGGNLV